MTTAAAKPSSPIAALGVAGYGAVLGSLFPVITVMTIADISGGLAVSADHAALVNTMQNVGSIAGILIAPSVVAGIGRGRTMAAAGLGFLLASIACAVAPSLEWMVAARTVQGFFSGVLPLMFMILVMTSLRPGAGQLEGMTFFAASTSLFFGLAASFGAGLVDTFGWRALFWAQALAVVPYVIAATQVLRDERGDPEALRRIDWPHYLGLTAGLSMALFAIAEGERHFWFDTWWVGALLAGGAILIVGTVHSMQRDPRPLLVLSVFKRPTFAWGITLSLFFRFGLLMTIYIVPAFLGRVQGMRPDQVGGVLLLMTPATLVALVSAWYFAHRIDSRWVLSSGLALFALAAWLCSGLDSSWAVQQLGRAAIAAGLGLGLFGVGVLRFSSFGAGPVDGPTVGVVFNLARVYGNICGLAVLIHIVTEREKFHSAVLTESLGTTDPTVGQRLAAAAGTFGQFSADGAAAQASAAASLARATSAQAFTLAFSDALTITAVALAIGTILVWALPAIPNAAFASDRPRSLS